LMHLKSERMRLNMWYMKELSGKRSHAFLTKKLSSIFKCNCEYFTTIVLWIIGEECPFVNLLFFD
jgi:hypothetical protein